MPKEISQTHPLRLLFRGLVENVFYAEMGLCDPPVTEYLSDMLTRFVHIERIWPWRDAKGRRIEDVAEMVTDVLLAPGTSLSERRRKVHQHIGDYALFWTGVYPEGLNALRAHKADSLIDYVQQGKRSYSIASELSGPQASPPPEVLGRLSRQFEFCVHGLTRVRKGWERLSPETFHRRS